MDDQYELTHRSEYQADDEALQVLRAIAANFRRAKHLVIVGPYDDEGACEVQFTDPGDQPLLDADSLEVPVGGKTREIAVRATLRRPPVLFSSVMAGSSATLPLPPSGRSMGGDAIWQANAGHHGTAAFFASQLVVSATPHSSSNPAPVLNNVALSCKHILAGLGNTAPIGSPVSMVLRPDELELVHKADEPIDAACASLDNPADYRYCEIRALGKIAGVRRPHRQMRVHKYGARTGLTSGVIGRVFWWMSAGQALKVFEVRGRFACVHDSGAAVVNDARELVGLVFRGSAGDCNLDTVTYIMAAAPYRSSPPIETFFVEYS